MSSPITSKRKELDYLTSEKNLYPSITSQQNKRRKAAETSNIPTPTSTSKNNITIRIMESHEINEVLKMSLNGLLEFCTNENQRKATLEFHNSHLKRNVKLMQKDCDEGYRQFNRRVWVAVSNTKILGSMEIKPRPYKSLNDRDGVQLHHVSVLPEYRGTGLAQRLLKHVESYCKEQKIGSIYLTTQDNLTRAINFYKKEGYELTHQKKWESYLLYYYKKNI